MMGPPAKQRISTLTADQLLGPLNDVERKYAPVRLYAAGPMQIPLPRPRAAIIGSRKASEKALDVASEISKTLVKKKVIIVSGLAEGIDTAGHRAAIDAGGKTVAVLGTPLDQVYPEEECSAAGRDHEISPCGLPVCRWISNPATEFRHTQ